MVPRFHPKEIAQQMLRDSIFETDLVKRRQKTKMWLRYMNNMIRFRYGR